MTPPTPFPSFAIVTPLPDRTRLRTMKIVEAQRFGAYEARAQLGYGATSRVLLAATADRELVVLKAPTTRDPHIRAIFQEEARIARKLSHPNLVTTFAGDDSLLVLEYLEGKTLAQLTRHGKVPIEPRLAVSIVVQALRGLHHAHGIDAIVHRDVSPSNVFVTYDGGVKLLDFGIAKAAGRALETPPGVIKGKLRYMAPEQMAGGTCDRRSDLFPVGVVLWDICAGKELWSDRGHAEIVVAVMAGRIPEPPPRPGVPEGLRHVAMRALSLDRQARHASAAELAADLTRVLGEMGGLASAREIAAAMELAFPEEREARRADIEELFGPGARPLRPSSGAVRPLRFLAAALALLGVAMIANEPRVPLVELRGSPPPQIVVPPAPPEIVAPTVIEDTRFEVRARPRNARVFLDGVEIGGAMISRVVSRDHRTHTLRVEAPGHVTRVLDVRFDRDSIAHDVSLTRSRR